MSDINNGLKLLLRTRYNICSDANKKNTCFFYIIFFNHVQKNLLFFIFYILEFKERKDISILWSAYSVIDNTGCKHYMNCIYIDKD